MYSATGTVAALLAAAVVIWPSSAGSVARRLRTCVPPPDRTERAVGGRERTLRPDPRSQSTRAAQGGARPSRRGPGTAARRAAACLAGLGVGAVAGFSSPAGPLSALGVAVVAERVLAALIATTSGRDDAAVLADLPLALDLVAACLASGTAVSEALDVVSRALPGPTGTEFAVVARGLRLGARPDQACWAITEPGRAPALAALARALGRADMSGSRLAAELRVVADGERAAAHARGLAAARRAGVSAVAPLGLCFLPAFVLVGIVPVVVSAIGNLGPLW